MRSSRLAIHGDCRPKSAPPHWLRMSAVKTKRVADVPCVRIAKGAGEGTRADICILEVYVTYWNSTSMAPSTCTCTYTHMYVYTDASTYLCTYLRIAMVKHNIPLPRRPYTNASQSGVSSIIVERPHRLLERRLFAAYGQHVPSF